MKSKKERAFYFQASMVIAYIALRFFNPSLSNFDQSFTVLMSLLASYHLIQGGVDMVAAGKGRATDPENMPKVTPVKVEGVING